MIRRLHAVSLSVSSGAAEDLKNIPSLVFIVNPVAGKGQGRKLIPRLSRELDKMRLDYVIQLTEGPGHAVLLSRRASAGGAPAVVACGGDGTVHEVINGADGAAVGIVPCGTGNDFAAMMGIPAEIGAACRVIAAGSHRRIDLAKVGRRLFSCIAGAGFDSMVNRRANQSTRLLRGTSVYVYSLLSTLASFRPFTMRVETDRASYEGRVMFVVAANAASYGGGMRIAPMAQVDDGLLDLVIVEAISKLELLRVFPKVFSGQHMDHPAVKHHRISRAHLWTETPMEIFADGEFIQALPVSIEVLPQALTVLAP